MTPAEASAWIGVGELGMVGELLPFIAPEHLNQVRWLLRQDSRWPEETHPARVRRLLLLDAVCRRMVEAGVVSDLEYLVVNGDAFPDAPADVSGLLDQDTP